MNITLLKSDYFDVYLNSSALMSLLGPIVENYTSETGGLLIGNLGRAWINGNNRPIIIIQGAFPSMQAKTSSKSWSLHPAAYKRMKGFALAHSVEILGEYHSHPRGSPSLSPDDEAYIRSRFQKKMATSNTYIVYDDKEPILNDDGEEEEGNFFLTWIELVIGIKKKPYQQVHSLSSGYRTPNGSSQLNGLIKIGEKHGFGLSIGAWGFIASPDTNHNFFIEMPVYTEISSSFEEHY